jgi:predicted HAD superfamily Cof-like phosphohydrolase
MPSSSMIRGHRSTHQRYVDEFMNKAKQETPDTPTIPSEDVRLLRAKLIFEECMETVAAMGVEVITLEEGSVFRIVGPCDIVEVADGCADIAVVTTGTLSAFGIADYGIQKLVDQNNLDKFGPGHSFREDGKLEKPPGHKPPDILSELQRLGYEATNRTGGER